MREGQAIADDSDAGRSVPSRRSLRRAGRRHFAVAPLVIALVCVMGAALLIYPAAASWFSALEQSQRVDVLTADLTDLGVETLHERIAEAHAYNDLLTGGAAVAANERLPLAENPDQTGRFDYDTLLRADAEGLMARLKIPSIDVDLPVYHGTSDAVLEEGIGHLEGTALPVGGASTHSVLTGHRGLATSELFTHLDQVKVDDTFTVEVFGEVLVYRVIDTSIVEPEETEALLPEDGRDLMTLVTCTPIGINTHRILVTGERVIPTPRSALDDAGSMPEGPGFPWWIVASLAVLLLAAAYVWWSGRPPRTRAPAHL